MKAQSELGNELFRGGPIQRREAHAWWRKAARAGDADAQINLGVSYGKGEGVRRDPRLARRWLKRAVAQGSALAQSHLGSNLFLERPIRKGEAIRWWRKAARAGDVDAQMSLAICYDRGDGVRRSYRQERKWLELAAAQGDAQAQANLGFDWANGLGGPKDRARANRLYRSSAAGGNRQAMGNLGIVHLDGLGVRKSVRRADVWFRKAAELGDVDSILRLLELAEKQGFALDERQTARWFRIADTDEARDQLGLGIALFNGDGVTRNRRAALRWYRLAAKQDEPRAWLNLGLMYEHGQVVRQSWARARRCLERAASLGDPYAPARLAEALEARDPSKPRPIVRWLEAGVACGDEQAMCALGVRYHNGDGVARDRAAAARLYRRAARRDHAWAMYLLGLCYRDGEGAERNEERARAWFLRAERAGKAQDSPEAVKEARRALDDLPAKARRRSRASAR